MVIYWLKLYVGQLKKNWQYFVLSILALSIGVASFILALGYYQEENSYDKANPFSKEIFLLERKISGESSWMMAPYGIGMKLKDLSSEVEDYLYMNGNYSKGTLEVEGKKVGFEKLIHSQSNFFEFFPVEFLQGSKDQALSNTNSIAISQRYANYLFDKQPPLGKSLKIGDKIYVVSAVFSNYINKASVMPDMVTNDLDLQEKENLNYWGNYFAVLYLKLKDQHSVASVQKAISQIIIDNQVAPYAKEEGQTIEQTMEDFDINSDSFALHTLEDQRMIKPVYLNGTPQGAANKDRVYMFLGLSTTILVLACFNFVNILIPQTIARFKQTGVLKVVGSSKIQLVVQIYFEIAISLILSFIFALVFIELSIKHVRVFFQATLEFNFWQALFYQIIIFIILSLVLVIPPAILVCKAKILEILKGNFKNSKKGDLINNVILVFQFLVASFFIVTVLVVSKQVTFIRNMDLGFRGDKVITVPLPFNTEDLDYVKTYNLLKQEFSKIKGVTGVSVSTIALGQGYSTSTGFNYRGNNIQGRNVAMDYDFLELHQIGISKGRALQSHLASDSINHVLVNLKTLELMQELDPIGKQIEWNGLSFTIVGVVNNFNLHSLKRDYVPMIFFSLYTVPWISDNMSEISIKLREDNLEQTLKEIQDVYKEVGLFEGTFSYEFLDKRFQKSFQGSIQERNVFHTLNGIVIFIAFFGLFSVAYSNMHAKLKQIAIRKVLGASQKGLVWMLCKRYILFCLLGFTLSIIPSYLFLEAYLSNYHFRINISYLPYCISLFSLLVISLLITSYLALKVTGNKVFEYLKFE
ncbi:ABC transporter permease [Myroides sp. LJL119]